MKSNKSTFLAIIFTLTTFLILSTGPLFAAEPITLKFANFEPAQAKITTQIFGPWADMVTKAGKGIIKIDMSFCVSPVILIA